MLLQGLNRSIKNYTSVMGNQNNKQGSRRWFLSLGLGSNNNTGDDEMVKMLTADGRLVTVKKSLLQKTSTSNKATNKDIYDWMNNPSKKESK
jgi:hypothetical protein